MRPACAMTVLLIVFASAEAAPKVGAYYYPWYGGFSGGHAIAESLRAHLVPPCR